MKHYPLKLTPEQFQYKFKVKLSHACSCGEFRCKGGCGIVLFSKSKKKTSSKKIASFFLSVLNG